MLSEVVYGSYSTDMYDMQSLSAMVDYWASQTAVKKDFEVARCKYYAKTCLKLFCFSFPQLWVVSNEIPVNKIIA